MNQPTMIESFVELERKVRGAERGAIVAYLRRLGLSSVADAVAHGDHFNVEVPVFDLGDVATLSRRLQTAAPRTIDVEPDPRD